MTQPNLYSDNSLLCGVTSISWGDNFLPVNLGLEAWEKNHVRTPQIKQWREKAHERQRFQQNDRLDQISQMLWFWQICAQKMDTEYSGTLFHNFCARHTIAEALLWLKIFWVHDIFAMLERLPAKKNAKVRIVEKWKASSLVKPFCTRS